ncbi:M48 family metallopeptidase [Pseudoduganella namucuonensis]|uniref:Peptidase family M48 n=1 Tax=Pseudoduganella namucuonensis TaxID=1035707 RepID=A0A1I7ET65_9BURK|nr:M48 family metallopeptidase [Pseudoduganella namucuonensis]SFU27116.1 Peptidase family M48 [Pseudoduganella namucuonensis]
MKSLNIGCAALALVFSAHASVALAAPAAQQDGIPVEEMSRLRGIAGDAAQFDQQSKQQYLQLMSEAQQKGALLPDNHPQVQRLRGIARRIVPYATRWNPEAAKWGWQVNLLNAPTINAFCMPGGRIAFFSGILTKLNLTDDEVAMVMGHEIAHALREHAREQAGKTAVTGFLSRLAGAGAAAYFGVDPRIGELGGNLVTKGASLKFSRDDEREADLVGMDLAARAGFDPRAGKTLWEKMGAASKGAPPAFLSTHPAGKERIERMEKALPQVMPVYARTQGKAINALPPYRSAPMPAGGAG